MNDNAKKHRSEDPSVVPHSNLIRHSNFDFRISPARSRGFTLIEMITVLTIIIIVLAIAIPVWNALMGGTNLAAAQNQISAFIAGTRADAIYNRQTIGVCFYIDSKSQQAAMAEVQVQTLYQPHLYGTPGQGYSSTFQPVTWTAPATTTNYPPPTATPPGTTADNGPVYSIELVNYPDPNNPGSFIFYRDPILLPKGVGVVLTNNTYTYNQNNLWAYNPPIPNSAAAGYPALDRYVHFGVIFFAPDGTLTSIPFGVPYYECFTQTQYNATIGANIFPPENQLCARLGMYLGTDLASNLYPPAMTPPAVLHLPLMSSVGFVIYDNDVYLNQHAVASVMNNSTYPATPTPATIGNTPPDQFSDTDMNVPLPNPSVVGNFNVGTPQAQDKYIEESWIDQNGTSFLVSPSSGSLIKAK